MGVRGSGGVCEQVGVRRKECERESEIAKKTTKNRAQHRTESVGRCTALYLYVLRFQQCLHNFFWTVDSLYLDEEQESSNILSHVRGIPGEEVC